MIHRTSMRTAILRARVASSALTCGIGAACMLGLGAGTAQAQVALPSGGTTVSGSATITTGPTQVTIDQTSVRAILAWNSFDVANGKAVVFNQPNAQSATLNRVTGGTASTIAGQIMSNGAVYLVNPNGIAITATGSVQTGGGFVASTLDIADGDFNAGHLAFTGSGASGRVSNAGSIVAGQGAYVALLGGSVSNSGTINVALGRVALGSGEAIALDLNGDGFMQVALPTASREAHLIDMAGGITAAGGRVELRAATVRDAVRNVINLTGTINADNAAGDGGSIILFGGDGGTVTTPGTLSARATGATGNGGFIETSGAIVDFTGLGVDTRAAHGSTGTWLVDPTDLTVNAAQAGTISTALATSSVTLQTTAGGATGTGTQSTGPGDIGINGAISWNTGNTLTLNSYHGIVFARTASVTGAGRVVLLTNQGGTGGDIQFINGASIDYGATNNGGALTINGNAYTLVYSMANLDAIDGVNGVNGTALTVFGSGLAGRYALATNLNAAGATYTRGIVSQYNTLASPGTPFSGTLEGLGHTISNLTMSAGTTSVSGNYGIALVGYSSGTVRDIGMVGGSISGGYWNVGGLVGFNTGTVANSFSTMPVGTSATRSYVGGLVGQNQGTVSRSYATGAVTGNAEVGGLVGRNFGGTVEDSYAAGAVSGNQAGGLVGANNTNAGVLSTVIRSFATGNVQGPDRVGGLIGLNAGNVSQAYATGNATHTGSNSGSYIGGLIGQSQGTISQVYATGAVFSSSGGYLGGLIGINNGNVSQAYASGAVNGTLANGSTSGGYTNRYGALIGRNGGGAITNAYYDSYSSVGVTATPIGALTGGSQSGIVAVSSNGAAGSAYTSSTYTNFTAAAGIGTTTPTGWVYVAGVRPMLAFEVPIARSGLLGNAPVGVVLNSSHAVQLIGYSAATLAANYVLTPSINFAETGANVNTAATASGIWSNLGFLPLGTNAGGLVWNGTGYAAPSLSTSIGFSGTLVGNGSTLSNLTVRRTNRFVGLFGLSTGTISGVALTGVTIGGGINTGALAGMQLSGTISGASAAGTVTGTDYTGGLIGAVWGGTLTGSSANATVAGGANVGVLTGYVNDGATVSRSSSAGAASGTVNIGGLIGYVGTATIQNSYSTATATGPTSGTRVGIVGGLIGKLNGGTVTNSYSVGSVAGLRSGGLIGVNNGGGVVSSYWNTDTGGATSAGGSGQTTAQLRTQSTFVGWDFATIWNPPTGSTYPTLRAIP